MLKNLYRNFFFSVPSLAGLSDSEKSQKLSELAKKYSLTFDKKHQKQVRERKKTFDPEQKKKISLILYQLVRLSSFEMMALKNSVQGSQNNEYNWPIFSRPGVKKNRIPSDAKIKGLDSVSSSLDLINKITSFSDKKPGEAKEKVEVVKVVEKTTFNIVLTGFDPSSKVKFIKCIKDIMGLGLKESKDKVEEAAKGPVVLFKGISKESHGAIFDKLVENGGKVEYV